MFRMHVTRNVTLARLGPEQE